MQPNVPQFNPACAQWAGDRLAGKLVPQAVGLAIEHQLVGAVEEAGGAEDKRRIPAIDLGLEKDAGAAQSAVGERHRHAADDIVEHFVPAHDAERIGPNVAVDLNAKDEITVEQLL